MKQFTLRTLLLVVSAVSIVAAAVLLLLQNRNLAGELGSLEEQFGQLESYSSSRRKLASDTQEWASLLVLLAAAKEPDKELFVRLSSFVPGSICCEIVDFVEYPDLRLYNFFENGTEIERAYYRSSVKSVQVLCNTKSQTVVDKISHKGKAVMDLVLPPMIPPSAEYYFPDGTQRTYQIFETGFRLAN